MPVIGPYGFKGGLNTKASAWTLPADCMTDSQNMNIVYGDITKRNGSALLNGVQLNSGAVVTGLVDWLANAGTRYLVTVAGNKIYQSTSLAATFSDITGAATIVAGQNNQHSFASLNNILAICGGTTPDTPLQWTGTGNVSSLAGTPPTGNIVCVANNMMFISGIAATPSRVYWSNVSDPNTWPAASNIEFRASDGDSVTCLVEQDQSLVIFKRLSIGLLNTQTTTVSGTVTLAPLTEVIVGIGCPGNQCADNLPDGRIAFFGTNGHAYLLQTGGRQIQDISDPAVGSNIQPSLDAMNFSRFPYAVLRCYPTRNQIWLSLSSNGATTNDTIYVFDYQLGIWISKYVNINANVMASMIDPRSVPSHPILIVTGDYSGYVYEQDKGNTDASFAGGSIDGYATISIQHGVDKTDFTPRTVVLPLEAQTSGTLTLGYGFNGLNTINKTTSISETLSSYLLDSTFIMDTATLAGPATLRQIVPVGNSGRVYSTQLQFRDNSTNPNFTVHPVYLSDQVVV
jgi:hypothetical protein